MRVIGKTDFKTAVGAALLGIIVGGGLRADSLEDRIHEFSQLPPEKIPSQFHAFVNADPPLSRELWSEMGYQLGLNEGFREWFSEYFEKTPVLWENLGERSTHLSPLQRTQAEWAVRFLIKLSMDDRPMKSSKYDYEDPELIAKVKAAAEANDPTLFDGARRIGLLSRVSGKNSTLAKSTLNQMNLSGAPSESERREAGISVADWLLEPAQRNRIPEIVRETWGDRAVLNAGIGLGPDNKPLAASKGGIVSGTRRLPSGNEIGAQSRDDESSLASTTTRIALGIAAVLLLIAGWLAFGRPLRRG